MIAAVMPVYHRADITMVRGEGCYLFDEHGGKYLDFATGIAVNGLGHCHPELVRALQAQATQLWHCSNLYWNEGVKKLADRLVKMTFADTVFFCSSGAEAVECGVKMIRRYHDFTSPVKEKKRYRIITFEGGFHGRTLVGISAGGNEIARKGYAPLVEGFDSVAFNDISAVKAAITDQTAGILVEPIQGEGGIREASIAFLQGLRALADQHGLLLFFDEVQCGVGRSGNYFAFEAAGIAPDIATVAKGIGNGFPLAACLATERAAQFMTPGSHGSTYGANPLAMAAGNAVLDVMQEPGFYEHVRQMGDYFKSELEKLVRRFPDVLEQVRGRGLMLGLKTKPPAAEFAAALRQKGLLTVAASQGNIIRILPPLIVQAEHIDHAIATIALLSEEKETA